MNTRCSPPAWPANPSTAQPNRSAHRPAHRREALLDGGITALADDAPWAPGDGLEVSGPIGALLLLRTGRAAGLQDVSGPGAARLRG